MIQILCSNQMIKKEGINYPQFSSEKIVKPNIQNNYDDYEFLEVNTQSTFSSEIEKKSFEIHQIELEREKNQQYQMMLEQKLKEFENKLEIANKDKNRELVQKESIEKDYKLLKEKYEELQSQYKLNEELNMKNIQYKHIIEQQELLIKDKSNIEAENINLKELLLSKDAENNTLQQKLTDSQIFGSTTDASTQENKQLNLIIEEQQKTIEKQEKFIKKITLELEEKTNLLTKAENKIHDLENELRESNMQIELLKKEIYDMKIIISSQDNRVSQYKKEQDILKENHKKEMEILKENQKQEIINCFKDIKKTELIQIDSEINYMNKKLYSLQEKFDQQSSLTYDLYHKINGEKNDYSKTLTILKKTIAMGYICKEAHLDKVLKNYKDYKNSIRWWIFNSVKKCCQYNENAINQEINRLSEDLETHKKNIDNVYNLNKSSAKNKRETVSQYEKIDSYISLHKEIQNLMQNKLFSKKVLEDKISLLQNEIKSAKKSLEHIETEYKKIKNQSNELTIYFSKETQRTQNLMKAFHTINSSVYFSIIDFNT